MEEFGKEYLDKAGLITLLQEISSKFCFYNNARLHTGLKLESVQDIFGSENIIDEKGTKRWELEQGKLYYTTSAINNIQTGIYKAMNEAMMGEVVLQFHASENFDASKCTWDAIEGASPNMDIIWRNNDSSIINGGFYQIRLTTNNMESDGKYQMFADLIRYNSLVVPTEGIITITYKKSQDETSIPLFNKNWEPNTSTESIKFYYTSDNTVQTPKWTELAYNDLKENATMPITGDQAQLRIQLPDANISLKRLMWNVNFDEFKTSGLNGDYITSMEEMLGRSAKSINSTNPSVIDLLGISNSINDVYSNDYITGLFQYRPIPEKSFSTIYSGTKGIQFEKVKSMERVFMQAITNDVNGDIITGFINGIFINESEPTKLLANCNHYNSTFEGCFMADALNINPCLDAEEGKYINYPNSRCGNFNCMLKGATFAPIIDSQIKDVASDFQIENIAGFIKQASSDQLYIDLTELLSGTNIENGNAFELELDGVGLTLNKMFAGCNKLKNMPVFKVTNHTSVSMLSMFEDACGGVDNGYLDCSNLSKWYLTPIKNKLSGKEIYTGQYLEMSKMFKNCPLYKDKNNITLFTKDNSNPTYILSVNFKVNEMFVGTMGSSTTDTYDLRLNLFGPSPSYLSDPENGINIGTDNMVWDGTSYKYMFDNNFSGIVYIPYAYEPDGSGTINGTNSAFATKLKEYYGDIIRSY